MANAAKTRSNTKPANLSPASTAAASAATPAAAPPSVDLFDQASLSFTHGNCYVCRPAWSIPPLPVSHDGLFFITQGQGWVQYDNQRLDAKPGHLFLTRQGQTISAGHDPQSPITTWSIGFNLRVTGGLDPLRQSPWPMRLTLNQSRQAAIRPLFEQFVTPFQRATTIDRLTSRGAFFMLLAQVFGLIQTLPDKHVISRDDRPNLEHSRLTGLIEHIESNLHQPLPVHALAKRAHVTPSHLAHLFRKELGMSPSDYVRFRRLTKARSLLRQSDQPIAQIGQLVGFGDPYHFSRVFRHDEGLSPRAYRNASKHPF